MRNETNIERVLPDPPAKKTIRTFTVNGKTYKSLAELAREAGIKYNAAVKRRQRGFSDYEIFFGKNKSPKAKRPNKIKSKGRAIYVKGKYYESIKAAYEDIQPKPSYNTVKQRIIKYGWSGEDAFKSIELRKKTSQGEEDNYNKKGY